MFVPLLRSTIYPAAPNYRVLDASTAATISSVSRRIIEDIIFLKRYTVLWNARAGVPLVNTCSIHWRLFILYLLFLVAPFSATQWSLSLMPCVTISLEADFAFYLTFLQPDRLLSYKAGMLCRSYKDETMSLCIILTRRYDRALQRTTPEALP